MNKMMNEDMDVENIGIMQGFLDAMDDGEQDEDERSPEELLDRRPDTPEILMNNLRGDMRSIDARRDELADLVGYQAATETPETVLAMLQSVLAQPGGGGIGALPQSAPMAEGPQPPMMEGMPGMPPPGMPPLPEGAPPMMPGADMMAPPPQDGGIAALLAGAGGAGGMPPGMPPDQPPIQMARGGHVQNFQAGSDEEGVTPVGQAPSEDLMMYPPDMVAAARRASMDLFSQQPVATPTLADATAARLPEYTKMLSADRGASEAQLLFDLGQRALGFAANVDDAGRPLRGNFMARLAGATRTLPASMGKRLDEINKIDRQIKTLALQQGEKDIDKVAAQNNELQKRKGSLINQVLQAQGKIDAGKNKGIYGPTPFGTGQGGLELQMISEFAPLYAAGALTPGQSNDFLMAVRNYTQESETEFIDPLSGLKTIRRQGNKLPEQVIKDIELGEALNLRRSSSAPASLPVTGAPVTGAAPPTVGFIGATPDNTSPEVFQAASTAPKSSFFDLADTGTGFVPVIVAGVARNVPLDVAGTMAPDFQQSTAMLTSMTNRVVNVLQENPRFPEGERAQILGELRTAPRLFSNKNGYINQIIALDNVVEGLQSRAERVRDEPTTGITFRQEAIKKLEDIASIRELFGIEARTITDPNVWKTLPPGEYIVINPQTGFKEVRPKY